MYRSHKRSLKSRRIESHLNYNKEKNNPRIDPEYHRGTGTREFYYLDCKLHLDRKINEDPRFNDCDISEINNFIKEYTDDMLESDVHDRTRWKSSVKKTKELNNARKFKNSNLNF